MRGPVPLGVEAFDQFENSNLIEYILGQGTTGSAYYDVGSGSVGSDNVESDTNTYFQGSYIGGKDILDLSFDFYTC